jgi:hypothetical protein
MSSGPGSHLPSSAYAGTPVLAQVNPAQPLGCRETPEPTAVQVPAAAAMHVESELQGIVGSPEQTAHAQSSEPNGALHGTPNGREVALVVNGSRSICNPVPETFVPGEGGQSRLTPSPPAAGKQLLIPPASHGSVSFAPPTHVPPGIPSHGTGSPVQ